MQCEIPHNSVFKYYLIVYIILKTFLEVKKIMLLQLEFEDDLG